MASRWSICASAGKCGRATLAAVLAFVPLATDTVWGPLAYVLIGGVMAGTLITLCFVPALYALWYRLPRREMG